MKKFVRTSQEKVRKIAKRCFENKELFNKIDIDTFSNKEASAGLIIHVDRDLDYILINKWIERNIIHAILHEIGHVETYWYRQKSQVEKELAAQVWAINRAKKMGWNRVATAMEEDLIHWGSKEVVHSSWNTRKRRHILAGRLARRRGLVKV